MAIYVVQSTEELMNALSQAGGGDIIELASGTYSSIDIRDFDFDSDVLIRSANSNDPAILTDLFIKNSSGLQFFDLEMAAAAGKNSVFQVLQSSDIHFNSVEVHGPANIGSGNEVSPFMIRESSNVTVKNSEFYDVWHAIAMLDNNDIRIENNIFHDIRTDGVRGGGVSNLVVKGNVFYDFQPAEGDHPDAIQLWSTNQTEVARNIQITDNLVFRGDGAPTQGIFIRDTFEQLPFENVSITGNTVIGGLYNGIAINGVNGGNMEFNVVLEMAGRRSWIRTNNDENFQVQNNRSTFYVFDERTDVRHSDNQLVDGTDDQISDAISAWIAEHRAVVDRSEALTDALAEYIEPETDSDGQDTSDSAAPGHASGNDVLFGNDVLYGNDVLFGNTMNDQLFDDTGIDYISGGERIDMLAGGSGIDFLDGGANRFRFNEGDYSSARPSNSDRVSDFWSAQDDRIELARVEAISGEGAFQFIGATVFGGTATQIRYDQFGDITTIVESGNGVGGQADYNSARTSNSDQISDFSSAQGDRIELTSVEAISGDDVSQFIGTTVFGGTATQIRYDQPGSIAALLEGNTDSDSQDDFAIRLDGIHVLTPFDLFF